MVRSVREKALVDKSRRAGTPEPKRQADGLRNRRWRRLRRFSRPGQQDPHDPICRLHLRNLRNLWISFGRSTVGPLRLTHPTGAASPAAHGRARRGRGNVRSPAAAANGADCERSGELGRIGANAGE
jgi:hypothetical protein